MPSDCSSAPDLEVDQRLIEGHQIEQRAEWQELQQQSSARPIARRSKREVNPRQNKEARKPEHQVGKRRCLPAARTQPTLDLLLADAISEGGPRHVEHAAPVRFEARIAPLRAACPSIEASKKRCSA